MLAGTEEWFHCSISATSQVLQSHVRLTCRWLAEQNCHKQDCGKRGRLCALELLVLCAALEPSPQTFACFVVGQKRADSSACSTTFGYAIKLAGGCPATSHVGQVERGHSHVRV